MIGCLHQKLDNNLCFRPAYVLAPGVSHDEVHHFDRNSRDNGLSIAHITGRMHLSSPCFTIEFPDKSQLLNSREDGVALFVHIDVITYRCSTLTIHLLRGPKRLTHIQLKCQVHNLFLSRSLAPCAEGTLTFLFFLLLATIIARLPLEHRSHSITAPSSPTHC